MKLPVTIDPRRFDGVIVDAEAVTADYDSAAALVNNLTEVGVATAVYSTDNRAASLGGLFAVCVDGTHTKTAPPSEAAILLEAARQLETMPERSVVVATVASGRRSGMRGWVLACDRGRQRPLRAGAVRAPTSWSRACSKSRSAAATSECLSARTHLTLTASW